MATCIQCYINYGSLLLKIGTGTFNNSKFVSLVAKELTVSSYGTCKITIKDSLTKFDSIIEKTGIDSELFLKKWSQWEKYFDSVTVDDVINLPLVLFDECRKTENNLTRYCLSLAQSFLNLVDQQSWRNSLLSQDFNFKLLKIYHPTQLPFFIDAFKELMRNYATGDAKEKIPTDIVDDAIAILNEQGYDLKLIFREVRDVFINNANISKEKLKYFGKWLFKNGRLQDKQESLTKIFRSEFLDDEDIVMLILQNKDVTIGMIAKSEDNADFVNKIDALQKAKYKDNIEFGELCESIKAKII